MADARPVSLRAGVSSSEAAGLRNELHSSSLDRPRRRVPVGNSRCDVTVAAVAADDHAGWIVTLTGQFIASQVPLNHLSTVTTLMQTASETGRNLHLVGVGSSGPESIPGDHRPAAWRQEGHVPIPKHDQMMVGYFKELIESGEFRPVIDRTYPLDQIVEAYRYVETGQKTGNVVISLER